MPVSDKQPRKPPAPPRAEPPDLAAASAEHARAMARYDALTQLRNASIIADAAFAKALTEALAGNIGGAQAGLTGANAVLTATCAFWQAIDSGSPYDSDAAARIIAQLDSAG